ncbi:hypothetical protein MAR_019133 [Mya arenaria]|uniref:Uncharacterized protein n=1 Tax=Mya arenaria TaxID=6604 RepID=A0ABY7EJ74_MYAAR|nr:hypothetical protein MAR_019133 [Mya arenaria]
MCVSVYPFKRRQKMCKPEQAHVGGLPEHLHLKDVLHETRGDSHVEVTVFETTHASTTVGLDTRYEISTSAGLRVNILNRLKEGGNSNHTSKLAHLQRCNAARKRHLEIIAGQSSCLTLVQHHDLRNYGHHNDEQDDHLHPRPLPETEQHRFCRTIAVHDKYTFKHPFVVSDDIKDQFNKTGVMMVRNFLSNDEVNHIVSSMDVPEFKQAMEGVDDGKNGKVYGNVWTKPPNDVIGMVTRCEKVVSTCEALLGGEVFFYHSKLIEEKPGEDGQFLPGSHLSGRINHNKLGGQFETDLDRVEHMKKHCPLVFGEMEAGDALFMHCNVKDKSILSCTTPIDVNEMDAHPLEFDKPSLLKDLKA